MVTVHFDADISDGERRAALFGGDIFIFDARDSVRQLATFAADFIEQAFNGLDPQHIHEHLTRDQCANVLAAMKPRFIHHPESERLLRNLLTDFGCNPTDVYFDKPRMRSAYPAHFLTSGMAHAFGYHRDTWYSAPQCQLNWWMPIYDITADNCMVFAPRYFDHPIANNSERYNYYRWNANGRAQAAKLVDSDPRIMPEALEPVVDSELKLLVPPGGLILFSASHLHATVPNTSDVARYSIDFRTVHIDDVRNHAGAPAIDKHCTGHTLRDYKSVIDLSDLPDDLVDSYNDGTECEGQLVWQPLSA